MNIVLIGMMGSGKSVVGKKLSQMTNFQAVDTDCVIESRYGSIEKIFNELGEEKFRQIEESVIKEICQSDNQIISTGGGVVLNQNNVDTLKNNGYLIFLKAEPKTVQMRVRGSSRPLLKDGKLETIEKIFNERKGLYEKIAQMSIDTDYLTVQIICKKILMHFKTNKINITSFV